MPVSGGGIEVLELKNTTGAENLLMSRTYGTKWIGSIYYTTSSLSHGTQFNLDLKV